MLLGKVKGRKTYRPLIISSHFFSSCFKKMAKYNCIAYLLWLITGAVGGHHFYLGRDHQGLLWLTSCGGLGIGWLRDFFKIPSYVKEANEDHTFLTMFKNRITSRLRPSIWENVSRVVAQILLGMFYRQVILWALPEEYMANGIIILVLAPLGYAFGSHMVSNIGSIRSPWWYAILGAYVGELAFGHQHFLLEDPNDSLAASVSMLFSTFAWEFDERRNVEGCRETCKRVVLWTAVGLLFGSLLFSGVYFNGTINTQEGEEIKVRVALSNFFKSPYWDHLKKAFWANLWDVWAEYKGGGWEGAKRRLMVLADFQGVGRSRNVLDVGEEATPEEIKEAYHRLAKIWHPDRYQGASAEERARAQERFMEIKEAKETLLKRHKRRQSYRQD